MMNVSKRKFLLVTVVLLAFSVLAGIAVRADETEEHGSGRSIESILSEIRGSQGIGPKDQINSERVDNTLLEELGEAVMSLMVPDPERHEWMDRMMGGEGSQSLAERHRWMGYRYLSGGSMGLGPMMGGGFGHHGGWGPMMGFGCGVPIMWIIIAVLIAAVAVLSVLFYKAKRHDSVPALDALGVLKKRFARGEIAREEYEQIRRDLA